MIAETFGAIAKDCAEIGSFCGGLGYSLSGGFERIAAGLNLSFDIAGLAAHANEIFETIVIRLKLIIGDAPVLNRQLRTTGFEKFFPVTLKDMRFCR